MNAKELKSLSRSDLLEMLIMQTERVERMEKDLEEAKRRAESREIIVANAGTLAEAAMQINEVFKAADQAAAQYLSNIMRMYDEQEQKLRAHIQSPDAQVQGATGTEESPVASEGEQKAAELLAEAEDRSRALITEAREQAEQILSQARGEAESLLAEAEDKRQAMERQTREECDALRKQAEEDSQKYWDNVYGKLEQYCAAQESLKALLQGKG